MKVPEGRLTAIKGFMLETKEGENTTIPTRYVALENGHAYTELDDGSLHKVLKRLEAPTLYNELYKRFPK